MENLRNMLKHKTILNENHLIGGTYYIQYTVDPKQGKGVQRAKTL